jgi:RNA polymerase sigma-70 factor (ECF subfamily)
MFNGVGKLAGSNGGRNGTSHTRRGSGRGFRLRKNGASGVRTQAHSRSHTDSADSEQMKIARAQQGDERAFEALFSAYKRRVYSLCLRMTHDAIEAEDLTQEAFLHLFRKISSFRGESAFATWLHRLVVNVVLMRLRKKTLRQVPLEEPGHWREESLERDTGQRESATRQYGLDDPRLTGSVDRITLDRAIDELPQGYRTIFVLHDVEGYEHTEIARLRKCSVGNSKSQLHKARVRLRELLRQGPAARRVAVKAFTTIVRQARTRKQDFQSGARGLRRQVQPAATY